MACASNPEDERPKNFIEVVSGDHTWNEFGIRIIQTEPEMGSEYHAVAGDSVILRITVEVKKDPQLMPELIFAHAWTPIKTKENTCDREMWREIFLPLNRKHSTPPESEDDVRTYVYETKILPDVSSTYRTTFNVKWNHLLIWANQYQDDCVLTVS